MFLYTYPKHLLCYLRIKSKFKIFIEFSFLCFGKNIENQKTLYKKLMFFFKYCISENSSINLTCLSPRAKHVIANIFNLIFKNV